MRERKAFISVLLFFPRHTEKKRGRRESERSGKKKKKKKTKISLFLGTQRGKKNTFWTKKNKKILTHHIQTHRVLVPVRVGSSHERRKITRERERKSRIARKQKEKKKNTDDDGRNASGFDATLVPSGKLYERWE